MKGKARCVWVCMCVYVIVCMYVYVYDFWITGWDPFQPTRNVGCDVYWIFDFLLRGRLGHIYDIEIPVVFISLTFSSIPSS